ncbi:MAG: hypothetical protein EXS31_10770 [Pedosphaera sp.]|nr:hypothetical protein [Pedosphaera sp.]
MKRLLHSILVPAIAIALAGCETTTTSSKEVSSPGVVAGKCAQCDCKQYVAARLIKGACGKCGHTRAEHAGHTH